MPLFIRWFILLLIFFSCSCHFVPAPPILISGDTFTQTAFNEASIKVLNWNIAKNSDDENWKRDFKRILTVYQPDLIVLQEARLSPQLKTILDLAHMGWNFAPNVVDTRDDIYSGVLTASRVKPLNAQAVVTAVREPVTKIPKISLITEYPFSQRTGNLLVTNIHAINFVVQEKFDLELTQLKTVLGAYNHKGPSIVSGDFNTWSQGRLNTLMSKVALTLHLKPVNFTEEDEESLKYAVLSLPLDHIFYNKLSEKRARVLSHISSSDHKPIFVEFN